MTDLTKPPPPKHNMYGYYGRADWFEAKCAQLTAELEIERMRLAGCGVAALSDTPESMASQRLAPDSPYWSASYGDVLRRTQECIDLRTRIATLKNAIRDYGAPALIYLLDNPDALMPQSSEVKP